MLVGFLILLREGLEAIFVVAVVLSVIDGLKRRELRFYVWLGMLLAVVCSLLVGGILQIFAQSLTGSLRATFQGISMIAASILLTYVMIWFNTQAKLSKNKFQNRTIQVISKNQSWRVLAFVFLAVFREGIEIVVFSYAAVITLNRIGFVIGASAGLLCVFVIGCLIYIGSLKIPLRYFFRITSVILIVVAAGFLLQGVGQLQVSNILPTYSLKILNFDDLLNDQIGLGLVLHMLFGYDSNPTLLMLTSYVGYFLVVISLKKWLTERALSKFV